MQNNEVQEIKFTKQVYMQIATDKTSEIANIREEREVVLTRIENRKETLKQLKMQLSELKKQIKTEKKSLRDDKQESFLLQSSLNKETAFARNLNEAFSRGDETIVYSDFYRVEKQKTR